MILRTTSSCRGVACKSVMPWTVISSGPKAHLTLALGGHDPTEISVPYTHLYKMQRTGRLEGSKHSVRGCWSDLNTAYGTVGVVSNNVCHSVGVLSGRAYNGTGLPNACIAVRGSTNERPWGKPHRSTVTESRNP